MDSQLPSNQEPQQNQITPEQLQQMKMMARQQAMQQVIQQRQAEEQQKILEITDTYNRLEYEYEMLDQTRRQLAARTALKDTFSNADQANN